ncbi:MAG: hypothetical protein CXR30_12005 [Geobacter sp.]|nr:MAG: hypothetical protein CXR30_12005 [Geobacter sp.]
MPDNSKSSNKKAKYPPRKNKKSKYSELQAIPSGLNQSLTSPRALFYKELLGEPRLLKDYSALPSEANNPTLLKICKTENVGPFRVTGLKPAVDSLKEVMNEVEKTYPDLVGRLNNVGMRVVRYISGTTTLSNHSWGAAIDLYVDGVKDEQRDDKILHGLALIAPIFNKHGWYSGAGYKPKKLKNGKLKSNEDSMHFEVSLEKLQDWAKLGYLGPDAQKYALKNETIKLMNVKKTTKIKEELTASTFFRQSPKQANNTIAPKELPQSNFFRAPLPRRPSESWPNWFGRKTKSWARTAGTWFR